MTPAKLLEAAQAAGLTLTWTTDGKLSARGPRSAAALGDDILAHRGEFTECSSCGGVAVAGATPQLCPECAPAPARVIPLRRALNDGAAEPQQGEGIGPWRCPCCHHLQAVATASRCEQCGAGRDWR